MQNDEPGLGSLPDAATADATVEIFRWDFHLPSFKTPTSLDDRMIQAGVDAMLDYDSDDLHSSAECVVRDIFKAMREVELQSQAD